MEEKADSRPAKRGEREVQPEEPSGGAEESMDAATSGTEEEAKEASSRRDSHDAVESNRKQRNDSETARDRRSPAKAKHDSPPSKEDANEEELEAGEIKDTDQQGTAEQQQQQQQCPKEEGAALEAPKIRPLQRKRRWLSSKSADAKPAVITISTDSLKNIISDVKPVPLADVKLDSSSEPEGADDAPSADENEKDRVKRKVREVNEPVTQQQPQQQPQQLAPLPQRRRPSAEKENIATDEAADVETNNGDGAGVKQKPVGEKIALTRKISIVSDDGSTVSTKAPVVRPPSPAKHLTSNILYITNLVRPFTVLQLKGLLARTGKIVENGFWIDKIKSKCYVKYETEDEATETRHALHGIRWPVSNPKCLVVDFGSEEAMDKAILSTLEDGALRATVEGAKDGKEFGWSRDAVKKEETVRRVREWDLGKKDAFDPERDVRGGRDAAGLADKDKLGADRAGRERGREIEEEHRDGRGNRLDGPPGDRSLDRGKRSAEREFGRERRRSTSVSPARKFKKKENEPPIRLLDDLFRKTKTTPCIYWLPLTTEQIAIKEEQRRKNMAEHLRRVEEQRKQEEERDRERKRERERRDRERERERERDRERERYREPDRDRDRRRSRSRERSRDDGGRRRHR
ncbi:apoptotic chromatin condensation inducer in the nucleus-like isoform X2 [Anopheles arabiensis]|nr:apoptotic chromatin condensation inducer in the nucleus-like isoform X2 [Anopheles arabiensis]